MSKIGYLEKGLKFAVRKGGELAVKKTVGTALKPPKNKSIVSPIALNETNQCTLTPPWFIQCSEYAPRHSSFKLLFNGEEAFSEIHDAIDQAKHSVNIICWGFQPSMYFKRFGAKAKNTCVNAESIGELLERKGGAIGKPGVKINILCYAVNPAELPINILGLIPGETTTPGQHVIQLMDQTSTMAGERFWYNQQWFARYDKEQSAGSIAAAIGADAAKVVVWSLVASAVAPETVGSSLAVAGSQAKGLLVRSVIRLADLAKHLSRDFDAEQKTDKIRFAVRGFSAMERAKIAVSDHDGKDIGTMTSAALAVGPSHHQKVVLIDYEDPEKAVAFVMGHNMLDEYWDTNDHSYKRYSPDQSHVGRNGSRPRHDFSSRVTGPVIGDLFRNFANAWLLDTNEVLPEPKIPFSQYKARPDGANLPSMVQITRTQFQESKQDIKAAYLQAVRNATHYIYIENQYFRWPGFAEEIKACAASQARKGRTPEHYGPLYVFVITNADPEGMGQGVDQTARMLNSLGRGSALPGVSRQVQAEDTRAELARAQQETKIERARQNQLLPRVTRDAAARREYDASKVKQAQSEQREKTIEEKIAQQETGEEKTVVPEEDAAYKVHVGTLVAPDTPGTRRNPSRSGVTAKEVDGRALTRYERIDVLEKQLYAARGECADLIRARQDMDQLILQQPDNANLKKSRKDIDDKIKAKLSPITDELDRLKDGSDPIDWVDVYVHAKLMLIDDTYMTVGSANINVRSMDTDSELNASHDNPRITLAARQTLWGRHTNGMSGSEGLFDMKKAFDRWGDLMTENKDRRFEKKTPLASLIEFFSPTTKRSNLD